jgi:hypothetical protein
MQECLLICCKITLVYSLYDSGREFITVNVVVFFVKKYHIEGKFLSTRYGKRKTTYEFLNVIHLSVFCSCFFNQFQCSSGCKMECISWSESFHVSSPTNARVVLWEIIPLCIYICISRNYDVFPNQTSADFCLNPFVAVGKRYDTEWYNFSEWMHSINACRFSFISKIKSKGSSFREENRFNRSLCLTGYVVCLDMNPCTYEIRVSVSKSNCCLAWNLFGHLRTSYTTF